jgi:integrase/recombinase XerD
MDKHKRTGQEPWRYIRSYLTVYLPKIRGLSANTVESYKRSTAMYCLFLKEQHGVGLSKMSFDDVTRDSVMESVQSLRRRGCTPSTCNLRLSALKSLLKCCADEDVGLYSIYQQVRKVPLMKAQRMRVQYMSSNALKSLLAQPDTKTAKGMRKRMMMILLCDAGLRVQELVDLMVSDLQLHAKNPFVIVTGKGRKRRSVPLMDKTVAHLKEYLRQFHMSLGGQTTEPLFYSARSGSACKLSTDAVAVMLKNYAKSARMSCPEVPRRVHPHLFRHTRAMDLYRAGMPLS